MAPECFSPFRYLHEPPWLLPTEATTVGWDSHPRASMFGVNGFFGPKSDVFFRFPCVIPGFSTTRIGPISTRIKPPGRFAPHRLPNGPAPRPECSPLSRMLTAASPSALSRCPHAVQTKTAWLSRLRPSTVPQDAQAWEVYDGSTFTNRAALQASMVWIRCQPTFRIERFNPRIRATFLPGSSTVPRVEAAMFFPTVIPARSPG